MAQSVAEAQQGIGERVQHGQARAILALHDAEDQRMAKMSMRQGAGRILPLWKPPPKRCKAAATADAAEATAPESQAGIAARAAAMAARTDYANAGHAAQQTAIMN